MVYIVYIVTTILLYRNIILSVHLSLFQNQNVKGFQFIHETHFKRFHVSNNDCKGLG